MTSRRMQWLTNRRGLVRQRVISVQFCGAPKPVLDPAKEAAKASADHKFGSGKYGYRGPTIKDMQTRDQANNRRKPGLPKLTFMGEA